MFTRHQFIQQETKRELIRLRGEIDLATGLLGAHVSYRAYDSPRVSDALRMCNGAGVVGGASGNCGNNALGESEIEDFDTSVLCDQDIVGLQIAMNNASGVTCRHPGGYLNG